MELKQQLQVLAKLGHRILWYLVLLVSNACFEPEVLEISAFKGFPLKLFQNGLFFCSCFSHKWFKTTKEAICHPHLTSISIIFLKVLFIFCPVCAFECPVKKSQACLKEL